MLKRTKGRLLLTLLVITGLAGTLNNSSLSQKERKQAISLIKSNRNEVVNSIQGLSPRQIKYRLSSKDISIGELILNLTALEEACNKQINVIMARQANAENRLKIAFTDDQLLASNTEALHKTIFSGNNKLPGKDPAEALKKFIALTNHQIRYIRTSTEDLRNHVVETAAGWIDCYQYYLLMADQSEYFAEQISKIKSSPRFPKK
jgi:hypothetical protein